MRAEGYYYVHTSKPGGSAGASWGLVELELQSSQLGTEPLILVTSQPF